MIPISANPAKKTSILGVALFAFFCALLYHLLAERQATVELNLRSSGPTLFKLYWLPHPEAPWSEDIVCRVPLKQGEAWYTAKLTDLANIAVFRIDPSEKPAEVCIRSIAITQNGYAPIRLEGNELSRIVRGAGIESMRLTDEGLVVTPATNDPQLFFDLPGARHKTAFWSGECMPLAVIVLCVFLAGLAFVRFAGENAAAVPICLVAALVLIVSIAAVSNLGAHPDEHAHRLAGDYYQEHFLPPPVGAEHIRHTYSGYGVSRLHSGEAAYFFLGKFARLFHALGLPSFMKQRLFNVCLWTALLVLALVRHEFRILMVPALLSPQVWYVFGYVNSDAFAVFVMMLAAWQVAAPRSAWNRLLDGATAADRPGPFAAVCLGLLFGLLFLLKKNFYFFLLFLGLHFLWRIVFGHTRLNRGNLRRIGVVLLIGLGLFAGVRGTDAWVNDFQKGERMLQARYQFADRHLNPGTPLEQRYIYMQMRDRGVSLKRVLTANRWGEKFFRSIAGMYGFMRVSAPTPYYRLYKGLGLLLLAIVTVTACLRGGREGMSLWLLTLVPAGALVAFALYSSWTVDFQPQGRYALPIVGMLAVFAVECRAFLFGSLVSLCCAGLFFLSSYSVVCVALPGFLQTP